MGDLTEAQVRALTGMTVSGSEGLGSAYGLGTTMKTMQALEDRRYVKPFDRVGWLFSPRTCQWQITPAGIAALTRQEDE